MAKITGYNRNSQQTITTLGGTFSIPPSEDFTDGTWNSNGSELCLSEIGINETDNKAYVRIGNNINQFSFVGGVNGNNLSQTLAIGNNSGTYSIIMGTATTIKSLNGGGQIELDSSTNGGGAGSVYLSTDSGGYAETGMFLEPGNGAYIYSYDGGIALDTNSSGILLVESGSDAGQLRLTTGWLEAVGGAIFIKDNTIISVTSSNTNKASVSISSQNSSFQSGIYNSVILGGYGIIATHSNSVYASKLNIVGDAGNYYWKHNTDLLQLNTATTSTVTSIPMSDDQTMTIKCIVNAYCSYPNRNYGATLMASFVKYGGYIYQTSTTSIDAKDGFGDGTTVTIDTDYTNVRIRVTLGSSGLTTNFVVAYEYLTSN